MFIQEFWGGAKCHILGMNFGGVAKMTFSHGGYTKMTLLGVPRILTKMMIFGGPKSKDACSFFRKMDPKLTKIDQNRPFSPFWHIYTLIFCLMFLTYPQNVKNTLIISVTGPLHARLPGCSKPGPFLILVLVSDLQIGGGGAFT